MEKVYKNKGKDLKNEGWGISHNDFKLDQVLVKHYRSLGLNV